MSFREILPDGKYTDTLQVKEIPGVEIQACQDLILSLFLLPPTTKALAFIQTSNSIAAYQRFFESFGEEPETFANLVSFVAEEGANINAWSDLLKVPQISQSFLETILAQFTNESAILDPFEGNFPINFGGPFFQVAPQIGKEAGVILDQLPQTIVELCLPRFEIVKGPIPYDIEQELAQAKTDYDACVVVVKNLEIPINGLDTDTQDMLKFLKKIVQFLLKEVKACEGKRLELDTALLDRRNSINNANGNKKLKKRQAKIKEATEALQKQQKKLAKAVRSRDENREKLQRATNPKERAAFSSAIVKADKDIEKLQKPIEDLKKNSRKRSVRS